MDNDEDDKGDTDDDNDDDDGGDDDDDDDEDDDNELRLHGAILRSRMFNYVKVHSLINLRANLWGTCKGRLSGTKQLAILTCNYLFCILCVIVYCCLCCTQTQHRYKNSGSPCFLILQCDNKK